MKTQSHNTETVLYACKKGEPSYMEEILYQCRGYTNTDEIMEKGQKWADANGYDRLRLVIHDMTTPPNFKATVNV